MRRFFLVFGLVLCFGWFFGTSDVLAAAPGSTRCNEAADIGNIGCSDGALYTCKCTRTLYGSCTLTDWSFYTDCKVGACRSSTKCAECTTKSYPDACSSGKLTYCNSSGLKDSVNCLYGCRSGTACAQCNASKGCKVGDVCLSGVCRTPVDGDCGSANNTSRSSAPGASSRCSDGTATSVVSTPNTTRIKYDGWEWSCIGSYGGSDADCQAYVSCQKYAKNQGYDKGTCEMNSVCSEKFGGHMYTKTFDCAFAGGGCCEYSTDSMECYNDGVKDVCGSCEVCKFTGPGASLCVSTRTEGEDGECEDINRSYCSYSSIPKCKTSYGVTDNDKTASDGKYNWTCKGQSASGCRSAGTSVTCSAVKGSAAVSSCGGAVNNIYSTGADPENIPINGDLCAENNTSDWDCANCDPDGFDGTLNWTCAGDCNTPINCSAVNDVPPGLDTDPITIQNETGGSVTVDAPNINQICDTEFNQSRVIKVIIRATDVNGKNDVGDAILRFVSNNDSNKYTTTGVGATNGSGVITFTVDTTEIPNDMYSVYVQISDNDVPTGNSGWIDTGRDFKIWNCLVNVNGIIYDGSDQPISCSGNTGYTKPIPSESNFTMTYFAGEGNSKSMVVTAPNFTSNNEDSRKLVWNSSASYHPVFDGLPGRDPSMARVNDTLCVNDALLDPKLADPYADNPSLKVEYSIVMIQDAWFSVNNGSVFSGGKVTNFVPVTCKENCKTAINGIVWNKENSSGLSSHDLVDKKYQNKSFDAKNYTYTYFKNNYFSKLGIGTTVAGPKNWSEIESPNLKGIILVSGNLTIDKDITGNDFRMIVAEGDINIGTGTSRVDAVLMAKTIKATGDSDKQLVINGSLYGSSLVTLDRSFTNKLDNNETPAVKVNYDPSIIFNMPKEVAKSITQWRVN